MVLRCVQMLCALMVLQSVVWAQAQTGSDANTRQQKAQEAMAQGDWTGAAELFRSMLKDDPENSGAHFGLGTALIELDAFGQALEELEPLLETHTTNPTLLNNLAWIYAKAKPPVQNVERAIRFAQDALLAAPGSPLVWGTLAEAYYADKQYQRAHRIAGIGMRMATDQKAKDMSEFRELYERTRKAADATDIVE